MLFVKIVNVLVSMLLAAAAFLAAGQVAGSGVGVLAIFGGTFTLGLFTAVHMLLEVK